MQDYRQYTLDTTDEVIIALLSQYPFEAFEERESTTIGYMPAGDWTPLIERSIRALCTERATTVTSEVLPPRNWNSEWESSFEPVNVGTFCTIRADFHEVPSGYDHVIHLQPKMAFGTGHHETTYMMIHAMQRLSIAERYVLDYGCGTGILAVLAARLGAGYVVAVDIEQESHDNTLENESANEVHIDKVICGTISDIHENFEVILANINRNVLLDTVTDIYSRLDPGGTLLMSGILSQDQDIIMQAYLEAGFAHHSTAARGNWLCMEWARPH